MAKKSPLQQVRDRFESKEKLAEQLLDKLERPYEDESDEEFAQRIRTMSNKKLLRLYEAHTQVSERFGSKDGLLDAITALHSPGKPDLQYRAKLEQYHLPRLLELHRQLERRQRKAKAASSAA